MPGSRSRAAALIETADVALSLAHALRSGLDLESAWEAMVKTAPTSLAAPFERAADGTSIGVSLGASLLREAKALPKGHSAPIAELALMLMLAEDLGAPIAETLHAFSVSLRDRADITAQIRMAQAGPTISVKILSILPVVGVAMGELAGMGTLRVLFGSGFGIGCLIVGAGLQAAAALWQSRIFKKLGGMVDPAGSYSELVSVALAARHGVAGAMARVDELLGNARVTGIAPAERELRDIEAIGRVSSESGVPVRPALMMNVRMSRMRQLDTAAFNARRLESALLLPLGLLVLPSFFVLSVVPVVVSLLSSTIDLG